MSPSTETTPSQTAAPQRTSGEVADFLRLARDRYVFALNIDSEDRALAEDDVDFCEALPRKGSGTTQWDLQMATNRVAKKRPVLTENRLKVYTAQVVNDGRQSKPSIKITPLDGGTKETAEYFQGRIRQIEYDCQADVAYDTSREQQVTSGRGFLRVTWEYEPGSFRKRAKIERIENQFSVVFGPSRQYDCSDAEYCFVISLITKEDHARKYGRIDPRTGLGWVAQSINFTSDDNIWPKWLGVGTNGEMIQEAEYWVREYKKRTLVLLSNGQEGWKDELQLEALAAIGVTVDEEREDLDITVKQYVIDGADILRETAFIGPYIPIVPVWGRESFVKGQRRTQSLIRYAKDPQRLLNLNVSNIAEQLSMVPKTPWWIPVGGVPAGDAGKALANLNQDPVAYALYHQYDPADMKPLNMPTRVQNEPPIQGMLLAYNQSVDAIKAAMGIFDASLGARGNETSGVAIERRKVESDNANFHFHDNEARSRNHVGRILLYLIPELDKGIGDRAVRSEDGKTTMVRVGEPFQHPETGETIHHILNTGNYGVAVSTGPAYTAQRDEGFDKLTQMAPQWPALLQVGGPTILRMSNIPGAEALADLIEKTLPPELQSKKPGTAGQQIPPEVQQKFAMIQQQANQAIEALTARVHQMQDEIDAGTAQNASRERIVSMQEETRRMEIAANARTAEMNLGMKGSVTLLEQQVAAIQHNIETTQAEREREHQIEMQNLMLKHKSDLQAAGHRAQAIAQNTDHAHQAGMAEDAREFQPPPDAAEAAEPAANAEQQ